MASAAGASNGGGGGGGSGGVVASQLCSPVLDSSGNLYVVSQGSGEVCSQQSDGSLSVWGRGSGQPSGAAFDAKGNLFVADFGHAAVLKWEASGAQAVVVTEYEGKAFKVSFPLRAQGRRGRWPAFSHCVLLTETNKLLLPALPSLSLSLSHTPGSKQSCL